MKRIFSIALILCLLLSFAACGNGGAPSSSPTPPPAGTDYTQKTVSMQTALPLSLLDGRTEMLADGAISFDWSGNADCEGDVTLTLSVGNTGVYNTDDLPDAPVGVAFSILLDGQKVGDRHFVYEEDGIVTLTLAEDLPRGEHTFRLLRQSKIMSATAELHFITLCGELKQMQSNAH